VPSNVRVVDLGARRTLAGLPALVRYLRRERPRAMLSTLEHANIMAVGAGLVARSGTRIVLREANILLPREQMQGAKPHVERALMRGCYRVADAVVAVSKSVEDDLARGLGLPRTSIRTIYNPIVTDDLDAKADAPLDDPWARPGEPPIVLGTGRLAPQKDFPTLLRAFAIAKKARPARLVILGEGKEREALGSLARELGVDADVKLPGFDHNPFRWMKRATVFVLSSIFEGLPGALIQAMACGCRVISTDCPGGSREILEGEPRETGALVPMKDPEAMAKAILTQLDEATKGPPRVAHPIDRFVEQAAVDAYLDVLGAPRGKARAA
jgi:glycosyltransferase involved in cell wall biosynthesis